MRIPVLVRLPVYDVCCARVCPRYTEEPVADPHPPVSPRKLLFLLPSDFFEGAIARRRLYRVLGLRITREYKLGRWCYYSPSRRTGLRQSPTEKLSCDSLFELTPDRNQKVGVHVHVACVIVWLEFSAFFKTRRVCSCVSFDFCVHCKYVCM